MKKKATTKEKLDKKEEFVDVSKMMKTLEKEKIKSELLNIPEPKHINYFFFVTGIPEYNIHSLEEVQDYLSRFNDFGFNEELKLDFLNYLMKTYRNVLASIESFNFERIEEREEYLIMDKVDRISSDEFIIGKLKSSLYLFSYAETVSAGTQKGLDKIRKAKVNIIKNDFIHSKEKVRKLLNQIENEIEYEKSRIPNGSNSANQVDKIEKIIEIENDKLIWKGTKQDLVALYDALIELDLIIPDKNKDQKLGEHFRIFNKTKKQPEEIGQLKHTRSLLKEGYAKPTDKMENILKKLRDK